MIIPTIRKHKNQFNRIYLYFFFAETNYLKESNCLQGVQYLAQTNERFYNIATSRGKEKYFNLFNWLYAIFMFYDSL